MNRPAFGDRSDDDPTSSAVDHFHVDAEWVAALLDADGPLERSGKRSRIRGVGLSRSARGRAEEPLRCHRDQERVQRFDFGRVGIEVQ